LIGQVTGRNGHSENRVTRKHPSVFSLAEVVIVANIRWNQREEGMCSVLYFVCLSGYQ
jgi:hypothetical protein